MSLLQHTSKLLIFLSRPLSEMKQLVLLTVHRQEEKVDCTSHVRGRLSCQGGTGLWLKQAVLTLGLQEHLVPSL